MVTAMMRDAWSSQTMAGMGMRRMALLAPTDRPRVGIEGMGDATARTAETIAVQGVAGTVSILASLHAVIGGIAFAGPVGAAIAGLLAVGSLILSHFHGCGQTCVQASNIANQVGNALTQNLNQYLAAPVHYKSLQAAALNNFDTAWAALVQACGVAQLQKAGQNCISDRQQGACKWKSSPGGWSNGKYTAPGPAGSGTACWNYFVGMRDPIANDPTVVDDPTAGSDITSAVGAAGAIIGSLPTSTWIIGGLAVALLAYGMSDK